MKANIKRRSIRYFGRDELPENLATEKISVKQILMYFDAYRNENWKTQFD